MNAIKKQRQNSKTTFYSLRDIVRGFLALRYSCAIHSHAASHHTKGFKKFMADGFPVLIYKKVDMPFGVAHRLGTAGKRYYVIGINGNDLPNDPRVTYSLVEISRMFVKILNNETITPKQP